MSPTPLIHLSCAPTLATTMIDFPYFTTQSDPNVIISLLQTLTQALATAREHLTRSLLKWYALQMSWLPFLLWLNFSSVEHPFISLWLYFAWPYWKTRFMLSGPLYGLPPLYQLIDWSLDLKSLWFTEYSLCYDSVNNIQC